MSLPVEHKTSDPLPKTGRPKVAEPKMGTVHRQWRRCGKPNCRCASGERADLHGPYFYRFWRERGRLRKRYVPRGEVEAVRAGCQRRQLEDRAFRARRDAARAHLRQLRDLLNDYERQVPLQS